MFRIPYRSSKGCSLKAVFKGLTLGLREVRF